MTPPSPDPAAVSPGVSALRAGPDPTAADATPAPWIMAVYNQKGGVGKTTTATAVAATLAACGSRVLLIDLDSQGNATTALGGVYNQGPGAYEFLLGDGPAESLWRETPYPGLFLLPASRALAGFEIELTGQQHPQYVLRRRLAARMPPVDHILIDCPPALGLLPVNALVAAHGVLMPVQSESFAHDGLVNACVSLKSISDAFNPRLALQGVVITMRGTDPTSRTFDKLIRANFAEAVFLANVPRDPLVAEAAACNQPVVVFAPRAPAAQAYLEVTREVLEHEQAARMRLEQQILREERAAPPADTPPPGHDALRPPVPLPGLPGLAITDPETTTLAARAVLDRWSRDQRAPSDEEPSITPRRPAARPSPLASPAGADAAPDPVAPTHQPEAPEDGIPVDWTDAVDEGFAPDPTDRRLRFLVWASAIVVVLVGGAVAADLVIPLIP
ncbi:ParA family protein [Pararhodospirillum oryzae]|uniref:Chromosome partitioning protein ParA n=1 Tax=Pararhodospirillum oryzae TaxID=478448 RepID=A0A512H3D9_9PROT|nr:ParA family protein [Pararhodospirillum oryzae]GEO79976.1 hypothetical protein ROR02_01070 [Pararhodospirillum oryzae]